MNLKILAFQINSYLKKSNLLLLLYTKVLKNLFPQETEQSNGLVDNSTSSLSSSSLSPMSNQIATLKPL